MTSREVVCCFCNHQFRENFDWDPERVRAKDGREIQVEVSKCPMCSRLLYVKQDSLRALDTDEYGLVEVRLK